MAVEKVKRIPRESAALNLSAAVTAASLQNTQEVVDYFISRFMMVPPSEAAVASMVAFLDGELGTSSIAEAQTYMEDGLRMLLHVMMSQPEYQLS